MAEEEKEPTPVQVEVLFEHPIHHGPSSSQPQDEEAPPAWAVAMQGDLERSFEAHGNTYFWVRLNCENLNCDPAGSS